MNNPIAALAEYIQEIRRNYEADRDMRSHLDEFQRVYEESLPSYNPFYPPDKIDRNFLIRLTYDGRRFFAENGLRIHILGCYDSDDRRVISRIGWKIQSFQGGFMYRRGENMETHGAAIDALMWIVAMIQPDPEYCIPYKEAIMQWVFADADGYVIRGLAEKYNI